MNELDSNITFGELHKGDSVYYLIVDGFLIMKSVVEDVSLYDDNHVAVSVDGGGVINCAKSCQCTKFQNTVVSPNKSDLCKYLLDSKMLISNAIGRVLTI